MNKDQAIEMIKIYVEPEIKDWVVGLVKDGAIHVEVS